MCVQPGFVKGTEETALGGLHSRPATVWSYRSWLLPPGPRREGCSHTPHFVLEESAPTPSPQVSSEASCSMRQVPVRTGTTHTLSSNWAWEGLCLGLS